MARVTIRMWTDKEYYKDVALLDEEQVRSHYQGMEIRQRHLVHPLDAVRVVVNPKLFPEAVEFEVIVERDKSR